MIGYLDEKFQVYNVLSPDKPVAGEDMKLLNQGGITPKVVLNDRIIILLDEDHKLVFYDVMRQKFIAKC